jgi:branched-chain amino acid transport system ATP-binding protein
VLVATRENERATQSFGVNVTRAKLTGFAFSGFFAALAGGLFVHHQQSLGVTAYAPEESLRAFTMVVIGGLGSLPGALLGAVFVQSSEWFRNVWPTDLRPLMAFLGTGVGLLVVLMALPGGLGSLLYRARDAALRRIAARRGILVPSLIADQAEPAVPLDGGDAPVLPVVHASLPRPEGDASSSLLEVRGLEVRYDGVQVLFGVDLDLAEGEVIALLGTNGAGKSTVLKAISGLVVPSGGTIRMLDDDLTGMAPHHITARGLVQAPGGHGVFPSLTVRENLRIAAWLLRGDRTAAGAATTRAMASFPELADRKDEVAGNLSGGQQQMLTLAMAFIARPRILMIDELSLGLAPAIVGRLLDVVRAIRDQGTAIVLVEQSVNVALTVAERAYFLEKGEVRFEGPTQELLDRPDVLRSVFLEGAASRTAASPLPARPAPRRAIVAPDQPLAVEVQQLTRSFGGVQAVSEVDLRVDPGEIVGIIGPNGAGKTTLFDLLSGFLTADRGSIALHGHDITNHTPDARARAGLGRSFQDARLFPGLTVAEAIAVALDQDVEVRDPLAIALAVSAATRSEARTMARVDELIALMGLEAFRDKFIAELSTGSRRIVDLACIMGRAPTVILFDEPSSGIAQREAEALGPLLTRVRDETGAALLVIEHDMPLVTGIADRLIAMDQGRPIAEGDPRDVVRHPDVVSSYLGGDPTAVARSGAAEPPKELVS